MKGSITFEHPLKPPQDLTEEEIVRRQNQKAIETKDNQQLNDAK